LLWPGTCGILRLMRARAMGWSGRLLLSACAAMLGCGTAGTAVAPAAPPPEEAAVYYPLAAGWKWAYTLDKAGGNILATYSVIDRMGDRAIVKAGEDRLVYAVLPDGIARREGLRVGDYLLKTPVRIGATWHLATGEAKVMAVGREVTVPAGTFPGCATIEESRSEAERWLVRTIYAAGVGPISIEVQVHDPGTRVFRTEVRAALIGVTRPGEDPLGPAEGKSVPSGPPAPATR
jgi:hypothetical protein